MLKLAKIKKQAFFFDKDADGGITVTFLCGCRGQLEILKPLRGIISQVVERNGSVRPVGQDRSTSVEPIYTEDWLCVSAV